MRAGEEPQLTGDLAGELAGRHQHERGGAVGLGPLAAGHDREAEGQRLAGAGGGLAGDVAAGEGVGQRRRLDGEGRVDAAGREIGDGVGRDAEIGE